MVEASGLQLSGSITQIDGSAPTGQLLIGHGTNGDFDGTLTAGEGIDVTNADGSIEQGQTGEDATTSNKGIASFSSDNFTVSSEPVTITAIDGGTF